jgi:hypothetical protein
MTETIIYPGTSEACNVKKQLEVQQWILDPSSRPYSSHYNNRNGLMSRSASAEVSNKSIVQKQLELQQMILGNV